MVNKLAGSRRMVSGPVNCGTNGPKLILDEQLALQTQRQSKETTPAFSVHAAVAASRVPYFSLVETKLPLHVPASVMAPHQCSCSSTRCRWGWTKSWPITDCSHTNAQQVAFLAAIEKHGQLRDYFSKVYGFGAGSSDSIRVETSKVGFLWFFVPGRETFTAMWVNCHECKKFSSGLLWGPVQDVQYGTRLVEQYRGAAACRNDVACLTAAARSGLQLQGMRDRWSFPGVFVHRDALSALANAPAHSYWKTGLPDNTWVEVMRIDRLDTTSTCSLGQVWFHLAPGSGIWWNTGRSLKRLTTESAAELWSHQPTQPCSTFRKHGYDTIQMAQLAVGETVILRHPPLSVVVVSIVMERDRQQNDSLANG